MLFVAYSFCCFLLSVIRVVCCLSFVARGLLLPVVGCVCCLVAGAQSCVFSLNCCLLLVLLCAGVACCLLCVGVAIWRLLLLCIVC